MPPVNSPLLSATQLPLPIPAPHHSGLSHPPLPPRTPSPSTFFTETAATLSSPVLDLASTLTIQAEDDIDHDNVTFLRRPIDEELSADALTREIRSERRRMSRIEAELRDRSWAQVQGRSRERTMADLRSLSEQEARERRLHTRRMAELRAAMDRRWHQPSTTPAPGNPATPYAGADNASNSLYDWAPAQDDTPDDDQLETITQQLREQQPNTQHDILHILARAQLDADRDYRQRTGQPLGQPHEPYLRSAAILQSVRRHRIGQAAAYSRQRDLVQRYNNARSELVRQYAADSQNTLADTGQEFPETQARETRIQRIEDLLTVSDAMRLDRQGESSSRSTRSHAPSTSQSSDLRNHRPRPDGPDVPEALTPASFVYGAYGQRLLPSQDTQQSAETSQTQHAAETLEDLRRLYLSNPRPAPPVTLGLTPKEVHMAAFKNAIEITSKLQDADEEDVSDMVRNFEFDPASRELEHNLTNRLRGLWRLHAANSPIAPTSFLQAGTQFVGYQSSSQTPPAWNSTNGISHRFTSTLPFDPHATSSGLSGPGRIASQPVPSSRVWLRDASDESPSATHRFSASPNPISRVPSAGFAPIKQPERWAVKVSIHSVDYQAMTLQGTMEAFDVPSLTQIFSASSSLQPNPSVSVNPTNSADPFSPANIYNTLDPHNESSSPATLGRSTFSTFAEGQIIDFTQHSLLTPGSTFSSSAANGSNKSTAAADRISHFDALSWRKLEPFASLSDEKLASALFDPQWIKEELLDKYVLMRWKERCFVSPTTLNTASLRCPPSRSNATSAHAPAGAAASLGRSAHPDTSTTSRTGPGNAAPTLNGYGLSINGFYYVSLRRSDGHCTGLYYEPHSAPYQHIELRVAMANSPALRSTKSATTAASTPSQPAEHDGPPSSSSPASKTAVHSSAGGLWAVGSWAFC